MEGAPWRGRAGQTLRRWLALDEEAFEGLFYCASVTRCYPGRVSGRGDRTPTPAEQRLCSSWRIEELRLLRPTLVITVGALAARAIVGAATLTECVGKSYVADDAIVIPLPHPSGASAWLNDPVNRGRLGKALNHARREIVRIAAEDRDGPSPDAEPCARMRSMTMPRTGRRDDVTRLDPEIEQRIDGPVSAEAVRETRLTPAEAIAGMRIRLPERGNRKLRRVARPRQQRRTAQGVVARLERERGRPAADQRPLVGAHPGRRQHRAQAPAAAHEARGRAVGGPRLRDDATRTPRSSSSSSALMHCVGMSVHRRGHEDFSLFLAEPKMRELLDGIYDEPERTVVVSEVLQAITSHRSDGEPLALEAGILRVADALDMAKGRSRIPFERAPSRCTRSRRPRSRR